jgi:DinB superfamily
MYRNSAASVLAICVLGAGRVFAADSGTINGEERAFLVQQLEDSKKAFLASISGLTEAQWKFKPAPAVWSVAECAEHIVLSEDYIFGASQAILKTPAVARPEASTLAHDRVLAAAVLDRSHKATAPEPIAPGGKIATPADAARMFTEKRDAHIAYVKSTRDDLRVHTSETPNTGVMDAYQLIVLTAAHSGRHTEQIKEVEANANFPAK